MSEMTLVFAIIGAMVVLFIADLMPAGLTALGAALALYGNGVLTLREALGGFGDPVVPFVASLTMVSASIESTRIAAWAGEVLAGQAGESPARLLVLSMLAAALLTAFIGPSGAVAAMLPVAILVAVRIGKSPSRLLMPMVFAAQAGSMLLLTGSLVNLIASEEGEAVGLAPFGYFEITRIGIPALAGTIAIVLLFSDRLVSQRTGRLIPADLTQYPGTLAKQYNLFEDIVSLEIPRGSPFVGRPASAIGIKNHPELSLISVQATKIYGQKSMLAAGDKLLVRGEENAIRRFAEEQHFTLREKSTDSEIRRSLFNPTSGFAEVLIPPRSGLVGQKMFPGMVTPSGDLVVLAIQRGGESTGPGETVLAAGDTVLLRGSWKALDKHLADPDVLSVDKPEAIRRQAVPMGAGAKRAIAVLVGMVLLLATGAVPAVVAALLAAGSLVLLGVLNVEQAYRSVNWSAVTMVGSLIPLSTAMYKTGAASLLADLLAHVAGNASPYLLLGGLFVLGAGLSQLISSTATALIVMPIAIGAAKQIAISPRPALVVVILAAAASFLTPIASGVNMMIQGPGGYGFGDYWKLGLPLITWYFLLATLVVPAFWSFSPPLPR